MAAIRKTDKELLSDAEQIIRAKVRELAVARKEINQLKFERNTAEAVRSKILGLSEYSPEPPKWLNAPLGKNSSGIPLVVLCDWHWGETVDRDQTGGLNSFNRRVARRRVHALYDGVIDLCFNHMTKPEYPGLVVVILGDMITGNIHEDLRETNDGPVAWSVQEVENHLIALLSGWQKKFGKVAVICVPGNHGRNTPKPRINNKVYESYEWLIYCALERFFRNSNVSVFVPNEIDAHFSVAGHRLLATHGDSLGVKGGDGLIGALGPIARGALKVGAQQRQAGRDFDTLVIGHYHIGLPRGDATPVLVGPCLIGHNTYAHLQLRVRASRPSQALAFIHPKHGFTFQMPVFLDQEVPSGKLAPWFNWSGARDVRDLGLDA